MNLPRRIWKDIRQGEYFDGYITVAYSIILILLNLLGINLKEKLFTLILAFLVLLSISLLVNRYRLENIERKLSQKTDGILKRKFPDEHVEDLAKADEILLIGVSLSRTIRSNLSLFDQRLQQGASIKVLLVDPLSPAADIAASRLPVGVNIERTQTDIQNSLLSLKSIAKDRDCLEVRVINNPMSFGGMWLDTGASKGIIYLEQYSFKMQDEDVPKLVLHPEDGFWYSFYAKQAQTLWENANSYIF